MSLKKRKTEGEKIYIYICCIVAFPMATHISRTRSCFPSFCSLPGCPLCPPAGSTAGAAQTTNSSWQLLSVLRPVGGKSLCPMKLQRAGDIFYKKN